MVDKMNHKKLFSTLALALATMASAPMFSVAQADTRAPNDGASWGLQLGADDKHQRFTVNYETAPWWVKDTSWGRWTLQGEFGVSYWHATRGGDRSAWQASVIPLFRWWWTERFFLEGGIGITAFSRTQFADRELSTAMQFGDHIGLGYQLTPNMRIAARVSHFSNAGIKRPNRGINAYQIGLSWRW